MATRLYKTSEALFWMIILISASSTYAVGCDSGWQVVSGQCLKRFGVPSSEKKSWTEAEAACVALGGHLASMQTLTELSAIAQICFADITPNWQTDCHIGLHVPNSGSQQVWTDGTAYSAQLDPRVNSDHNCAQGTVYPDGCKMGIEGHYGVFGILQKANPYVPHLYVCGKSPATSECLLLLKTRPMCITRTTSNTLLYSVRCTL